MEAALLCTVTYHPALNNARELAGIEKLKILAASKFICKQSSMMMKHAQTNDSLCVCGKSSQEKHDAAKVVLTFCVPSPNKTADMPGMCDRACIMSVPSSTLHQQEQSVSEKRRQLTAAKRGIYWMISKLKKGYSTISNKL